MTLAERIARGIACPLLCFGGMFFFALASAALRSPDLAQLHGNGTWLGFTHAIQWMGLSSAVLGLVIPVVEAVREHRLFAPFIAEWNAKNAGGDNDV